jgi:hypothetical protein
MEVAVAVVEVWDEVSVGLVEILAEFALASALEKKCRHH